MSRSKANQQYIVGIPRDSHMNAFYRQRAAENGVKVPTYLFQLLKAIYESSQEGNVQINALHSLSLLPGITSTEVLEVQYSPEEALAAFGGIDEEDTPTERLQAVRTA